MKSTYYKLTKDLKLKQVPNLGRVTKVSLLLNIILIAVLETGNYVSKVCLSNKNLFGIKFHKCKYVLGQNLNHASYKSYKDNIKCYIHIQNRYLRNIDGKYAEAGNYISVLKGLGK